MLKLSANVLTWIVRIALFFAALLGLVMSLLVFGSVFMRYVVNSPWRFSDELVALLFSACVFLTIPYTFAMDLSIRVTLIHDYLPRAVRQLADALANIACIVFFLVFGWLSYEFFNFSFMIDARSDVARIPVAPWMALMPISAFLTALIIVSKWVLSASSIKLGTDEERHMGDPL